MKKVVWRVRCLAPPPALRYCKKCGHKSSFLCSDQFRVNAQQRNLDVWLIYKCSVCNTTWNAGIYSRVSPNAIPREQLDRFFQNETDLARQYAMDSGFLRENRAEAGQPFYSVEGDVFSPEEAVELEMKSEYSLSVKVSTLVRDKLQLSQREYARRVLEGKIKGSFSQDLMKCRVKCGITVFFS